MNLLHISHHPHGCGQNLEKVFATLGHQLTYMEANWSYNVDHNLANQLWQQHKQYFNSFDCIITSDTAPISRIFLQNIKEFTSKLVIWVCNRFDYVDQGPNGVNNPHKFPDAEYIELFKSFSSTSTVNGQPSPVKIFSYTKFEHEYALQKYGFQWQPEIIRPCCQVQVNPFVRGHIAGQYFIGSYHNDNEYCNLQQICTDLGITTHRGRYNGMQDLVGINGIIHIPYAWSNFALFENWAIGNVYLIPSAEFLLALSAKPNFFWSPPFTKELLSSSEWYLPEHKDNFLYFDSWAHLQWITQHPQLVEEKKQQVIAFAKQHHQKTLQQWSNAVEKW